ncbi:PPOX class F420-dependent oxidoreductase [Tsukamurella sp. NPDC003166]|uniref:PPOX class F420-dependent oxidoreductase n=1 Tax=Tsukamurella sp. NPDC003166 TaxID=3154444 RepID=UPI0033AA73A8
MPELNADALAFVTERHLASLVTLRADGTPHSVAIAFTYDPVARVARVITSGDTQKARNAARGGYAALTQVDGPRWLTLEGPARVLSDAESVRDAEARYAVRYKPPRENPKRVVIEVTVARVLGSAGLRA